MKHSTLYALGIAALAAVSLLAQEVDAAKKPKPDAPVSKESAPTISLEKREEIWRLISISKDAEINLKTIEVQSAPARVNLDQANQKVQLAVNEVCGEAFTINIGKDGKTLECVAKPKPAAPAAPAEEKK